MKFSELYCTPITGQNLDEFLENLNRVQQTAKFVELRTDYISNFRPEMVSKIKQNLNIKGIFTCRKIKDGGNFQGLSEKWKEIIEESLKLGFDYVDIEFPSIEIIDLDNKHPQTKVITSYHHFNHTPGYRNLRKIQKRMRGFKPDLMKFATKVKTDEDGKILLRLLLNKKKNEKITVLGMGQKGKITRVLGPILGSQISYVPEQGMETAPGQISQKDLKQYLNLLKNLI